jgi:hypothetical protein
MENLEKEEQDWRRAVVRPGSAVAAQMGSRRTDGGQDGVPSKGARFRLGFLGS